jgi:hypothetical protein
LALSGIFFSAQDLIEGVAHGAGPDLGFPTLAGAGAEVVAAYLVHGDIYQREAELDESQRQELGQVRVFLVGHRWITGHGVKGSNYPRRFRRIRLRRRDSSRAQQ